MSLPLKWEFPGGKIDKGEAEEDCLHREIMEELRVRIRIHRRLPETYHRYDEKEILLIPFVCSLDSGVIHLTEHASFQWLSGADLDADVLMPPMMVMYGGHVVVVGDDERQHVED